MTTTTQSGNRTTSLHLCYNCITELPNSFVLCGSPEGAAIWPEFTVHILSKNLGNRLYPVEEEEAGESMESQRGQ
jgi:hypothetical protein